MNLLSLLALFIPIAIGFLILEFLFPKRANREFRMSYTLKIFLATGIGYALASAIYFLWLVIFGAEQALLGLLSIEISVLIILTIAIIFSNKRNIEEDPDTRKKIIPSINLISVLSIVIFIIISLIFMETWQKASFQNPFGNWDAWAIWNLRASFLASGSEWLKGFSQEIIWSHPDYPLLLPLNVSRLWIVQAERSVFPPILLGLIFQLSLVGILTITVKIFRGILQGILVGVLGFVVLFVSLNFKLYADIPLAYHFLAANVMLFFADVSSRNKSRNLMLAGFLAGAALWTKNEGWVFLVSIVLSKLVLDLIYRKGLKSSARWWGYFLLGLAPILLVTIYFKFAYAPPGDILSGLNLNAIISKVVDPSRYLMILRFARNHWVDYGNLIFPFIPLLALYGIIVGISFPKSQARGILYLTFRILLLGVIYFVVYLLTPKDLNWHLSTSLERLITHIMPSFLFLYFLVIAPLNERIGESESMFSLDWPSIRSNSG